MEEDLVVRSEAVEAAEEWEEGELGSRWNRQGAAVSAALTYVMFGESGRR